MPLRRPSPPVAAALAALLLLVAAPAAAHSPSCGHHHHDDHDHGFSAAEHHHHEEPPAAGRGGGGVHRWGKLPEELAEEEDLELYGFDHLHHYHHEGEGLDLEGSTVGLWVRAMGCSLLVSMASLICLAFLPLIFVKGKPSKSVVDSLALFGAGAMLGDAFLHQLPHAFGGEHSHEHHISNAHDHHHEHGHSHSHSLKDLSVGLSILSGILLFLLVEKIVRYVEEHPGNGSPNTGHGHHHHKHNQKLKVDEDNHESSTLKPDDEKLLDCKPDECSNGEKQTEHETPLRKRVSSTGATTGDRKDTAAGDGSAAAGDGSVTKKPSSSEIASSRPPTNLVFGYLNLFSDGVHNFTDGMALGSAFLLHGSVGGWSRTLFLLAHELPQEVGDFGILVRSGFSVFRALSLNFLSALVALAGTALALLLGKQPGQSSLIEGFTAGGFIYIAVAGVLPEMNSEKTTLKGTAIHLTALSLGMAVALCISLVE